MESIVYAVDWNQIRENVFSGAAWLDTSGGGSTEVIEQLRKPTALVCSTKGAAKIPLAGGRKRRDDLLLEMIRTTVAKGGTVLIPTDTSARVLELAYVLEHAWRKVDRNSDNPIKHAQLYLASMNVGSSMRHARSMLEWMDENVVREFEAETTKAAAVKRPQHKRTDSRQNHARDPEPNGNFSGPFDFQYLRLLERRRQVEKILSTKAPRVILASDCSLNWGFSRDVLRRIAADPSNLIILTEDCGLGRDTKGPDDGVGATLWRWFQEKRDGIAIETGSDGQNFELVHTGGRELEFRDAERVPLDQKEFSVYQQYLATQRQLHGSMQTADGTNMETSADALDDTSSTSSSSSEESDSDKQGKALNTSATAAHLNRNKTGLSGDTLGVNALLRQPGVYDYDVRGKKGREQMFPFLTKRRRGDEFGELIRPEDYLRAEERDEIDGQGLGDDGPDKQLGLGQKRKWEEFGLRGSGEGEGLDGLDSFKRRRQQGPNISNSHLAKSSNGMIGTNGHGGAEDDDSDDDEYEPEEVISGPSKVIFKTTSVQTNLKIAYVDFAGVHDQRSLTMLIPLIQPRKLILIGGTDSETRSLASDFFQKLIPTPGSVNQKALKDIYMPENQQIINASVDTNSWTVKLSEALVRRLKWQKVRGLGIVTVMGNLAAIAQEDHNLTDAAATIRKKQKLLKRDATETNSLIDEDQKSAGAATLMEPKLEQNNAKITPTLDVVPANMAAATRSVAQPLHVGDLRLADLRKILQAAGHTAEFRGEGTLLIDGLVAVRKSATGKVEVEAFVRDHLESRSRNLDTSFHAVKKRIYEGLAVITGG